MPGDRAYVRNTADPRQVGRAGRKQKDRRKNELVDLRAVLEVEPGRRVLWRLLRSCGVNETVLRSNPYEMAAAAGQQNVGHFLMKEINEADPDALFVMMREARMAETREDMETDAVHTPSAEENQTDAD